MFIDEYPALAGGSDGAFQVQYVTGFSHQCGSSAGCTGAGWGGWRGGRYYKGITICQSSMLRVTTTHNRGVDFSLEDHCSALWLLPSSVCIIDFIAIWLFSAISSRHRLVMKIVMLTRKIVSHPPRNPDSCNSSSRLLQRKGNWAAAPCRGPARKYK